MFSFLSNIISYSFFLFLFMGSIYVKTNLLCYIQYIQIYHIQYRNIQYNISVPWPDNAPLTYVKVIHIMVVICGNHTGVWNVWTIYNHHPIIFVVPHYLPVKTTVCKNNRNLKYQLFYTRFVGHGRCKKKKCLPTLRTVI